MVEINQDIRDYLEAKRLVWKPKSVEAAASRLKQYSPCQDAEAVYKSMVKEGYRPYYIKICFITLATFTEWLRVHGRTNSNNYRKFLQENNQLFRNAYEDKYATITWQEYERQLAEAPTDLYPALLLLGYGGCRLAELATFDGTSVVGKGSKRRRVFLPDGLEHIRVKLSPTQIYRRLKKLGHNPHSYRKLAADKWLRSGVDIKTVQVLLGHSSIASTQRYLRPMEQDALKAKLEEVWAS